MRIRGARLRTVVPVALAVAALLGLGAHAWRGGGRPKGTPAASAVAYVYVVDWSGSTKATRRRLLGAALEEMESLPEGTRVVAYRMGSKTQEFYDGTLGDAGADAVAAALATDALPSDARAGTDFPRMAQALAAFSRGFRGRRFSARVLTDGGDDRMGDRQAQAEYRRAAAALCADRRLADLAFLGVKPGFREAIRAAFGKAGPRLRVLGPGEPIDGG